MDMAKIVILGSKSWKSGKHSNEKFVIYLSIYLLFIYLYYLSIIYL